ncbi:hypothetical protein CHLRE_11g478528v5 [Chlamydomonas reinhardtii]|uniref:Uncharacterized protein n=1 Tax=Chlamydomonas reinhardtii TaxID=3055 RepID=A0A2K3D8J5_CHLRE|nr:uncharacterized protein CHLRE_11g478528v5 [Chlamydomonas reinhardtii]PNW76843.1 hypothetical protein CHLRE_11g478528v5 [Chlamydomonas reinhardtii]
MHQPCLMLQPGSRCAAAARLCAARGRSILLPTQLGLSSAAGPHVVTGAQLPGPRLGWVALRGRKQQLCRALDSDKPGDSEHKGDNADDEIDRLLGLGKYAGSGVFGRSTGEGQASIFTNAEFEKPLAGGNTEVQETLADVVQMEVRRVRARAELEADMEERKQQLRAMGEEMKAALAREYELDRQRAEMGANYHMSEALSQLDDVEADIRRIKEQLQADKADLAAWEVRSAEERSKGLFFKSLYAVEKEKRQPVGKSIPGYYRKQREAAAAAGQEGAEAEPGSSTWDAEAVAAAAERPLSAASKQVRSPFRLYLFSYLSAFLALVVVNDLAVVAQADPAAAAVGHAVWKDVLYGALSSGLALVAARERAALGQAQDLMLDGIRRTTTSGSGSGTSTGPGSGGSRRRRRGE